MEVCEDYEDCRYQDNMKKCGKCERNPNNWKKMDKDENARGVHDRDNNSFYIFQDNYEPI